MQTLRTHTDTPITLLVTIILKYLTEHKVPDDLKCNITFLDISFSVYIIQYNEDI